MLRSLRGDKHEFCLTVIKFKLKVNDNKTELMLGTSKKISISIAYLLLSLWVMLKFPSSSL